MILAGFILSIITIFAAIYLITILSRNLNKFLSAGDSGTGSGAINFNFEAYDKLGL